MMRYLILSLLICQGAAIFAQNTNAGRIKPTIDSLNAAMERDFNANDMKKVAAYYSDDAEIAADGYVIKGRENLDKYWMDLKDRGRGWKLEVIEVGGRGEFVYQLGRSDLKYIRGTDTNPSSAVTNFIILWKLQPGGGYKIFRDYLINTELKKSDR